MLLWLAADAVPTRTAVGLAAVWEPCPSKDYGTSGELLCVGFTMCAQLWKRAKTKQTNNTIINLCTFLPFCFAGVATLKSFTLWLHWMCSICGLSFLSVVTSGAHIRHRADWITGKTRGCNLFLASFCVLCFYWAQWVELHTGFVSFTDYSRLCSYLIIKQNSAGTHHC